MRRMRAMGKMNTKKMLERSRNILRTFEEAME
jgi:hypothetical protein